MPTEKELERIIGASFGAACPEKEAAHAIAEELKKGVVAEIEGRWRIYEVNERPWRTLTLPMMSRIDESDHGSLSVITRFGGPIDELDGKRVRVTVTLLDD